MQQRQRISAPSDDNVLLTPDALPRVRRILDFYRDILDGVARELRTKAKPNKDGIVSLEIGGWTVRCDPAHPETLEIHEKRKPEGCTQLRHA